MFCALKNRYCVGLITGLALSMSSANAERLALLPEPALEPMLESVFEQVVVTGTRTARLLSESPIPTDVLDSHAVKQITRASLEQTLNVLPGVDVTRSVKDGFNIQLQGFQGNDVAVLVDGLPIISPTGSASDFAQLSALNINRIEVVRGAASVLYGSNAFGGVVNIITDKTPQDQLRIIYDAGAFSENNQNDITQQASLIASKAWGDWGISATYQHIDDPAFARDNAGTTQAAQREANLLQTHKTFSVLHDDDRTQGYYQYNHLTESKTRLEALFPNGRSLSYFSDVDLRTHTAGLAHNNSSVKVRASRHNETSGNSGALRIANIEQVNADTQTSFLYQSVETVLGAHYYNQTLNQIKQDTTQEINHESVGGVEYFLQTEITLNPNWTVLAGLRLQKDEGFGYHHVKKIAFRFNKDLKEKSTFTWRANIGEAYKVPTLKERFFFFDHSNLGYIILGNNILNPEEGYSIGSHLEYTHTFLNADMRYSMNTHYAKKNNAIETVIDQTLTQQQGLLVSQYQNIGAIEVYGYDIGAAISTKKTNSNIEYNYLHAQDTLTKMRLPDRATHKIKANIDAYITPLNINWFLYLTYRKHVAPPENFDVIKDTDFEVSTNFYYNIKENFIMRIGLENIFNQIEEKNLNIDREFDSRSPVGRYAFLSFELDL